MNQMTQENPARKKSNMKVIALALVCVILAASLVGVIAVYVPNNSQAQLTEKDNTIKLVANSNQCFRISTVNN